MRRKVAESRKPQEQNSELLRIIVLYKGTKGSILVSVEVPGAIWRFERFEVSGRSRATREGGLGGGPPVMSPPQTKILKILPFLERVAFAGRESRGDFSCLTTANFVEFSGKFALFCLHKMLMFMIMTLMYTL